MEEKVCRTCGKNFQILDEDLFLYKKFGFKPFDLCFECDQKRRLCFRNERNLYTRKCDGTGKNMISIYSPDPPNGRAGPPNGRAGLPTRQAGKPYKIFSTEYWHGDEWNALDYGRDFDFDRPFFEQFAELQMEVPRPALSNSKNVNSDYCNMTVGNKNCYLIFGGDFNEDSMYGTLCMYNVKSLDCDYSNENELCYFVSDSINCNSCRFAFDCKNCNNCYFVSDCMGCSECILCANLVQKSYCINNVQYSKDEYLAEKSKLINGSFVQQEKNYQKFLDLKKNRIVKYAHIVACENCSGDYLKNCKNCQNVFDGADSEDVRNVIFASKSKDCFNSTFMGDDTEVSYNNACSLEVHNVKFSFWTLNCSDLEYCDFNIGCKNMFGCVGMTRQSFCILNKQYNEEEFKVLREKIIEHMKKTGEWGQFLPKNLSCFGYNESSAFDYFPMSKEQALSEGFKWHDEIHGEYKEQSCVIPDNIKDISFDICDEILKCDDCGKNFKILETELNFYKRMKIPVPHKCSDCRHKERMDIRNPRKLWERKCAKCGAKTQSSYSPERPEKVYCEKCYLEEVY